MQRSMTETGKCASQPKTCAADIPADKSAAGGDPLGGDPLGPYRRLVRDIRRHLLNR